MAKDPREYGYEGEMAMSQLKGIVMHAKQLHSMLKPNTDLPEWVQSKITLAYDYIQTAADYMSSELNEDREDLINKLVGEEAPANAVGDGSGLAGVKGGAAPVGKSSNWNEPGVTKTMYAKKNEQDQKKNPVMAMVARTPLKTFREFVDN